VGSRNAAGGTLIEHWDGSKWLIVPSPNKTSFTELIGVGSAGSSNVWAVGYYVPSGSGKRRTLVEHWDGTKWSIQTSPNPYADNDELFGVAAVSPTDVWAVGANGDPGSRPLIEHFNGTKWAVVPGAATVHSGALHGVEAVSKSDVLAVGRTGLVGNGQPLVEQYNGHTWSAVATPTTPRQGDDLFGVSAHGDALAWVVGNQGGTSALQTLTMRNTGSGWQVVASPNLGGVGHANVLYGVSAISARNAWAVGYYESGPTFTKRAVVLHFSGGAWKVVPSASPGTGSVLNAIAAVSGTALWATGTSTRAIGSAGLIERGC
jgi:hypothetical protein